MGFLDKFKGRVKQSIEHVDWEELNAKKDGAIKKARTKTNVYKDDILEKTKEITGRTKQSIENVDWNELRSKKDDVLHKAKIKTNEYKEDYLEKTNEIKDELDRKHKEKIGEKLYQKEKDLDEREKKIKTKEEDLKKREKDINRNFSIPKIYVYAPLGLIALVIVVSSIDFSGKKQLNNDGSYSELERNVYNTYDGVDATDQNFDVGGYCLEVEGKGIMDFMECLVISGAKIFDKNK